MPRYKVSIHITKEIAAECEEEAIEIFLDNYPQKDFLIIFELEPLLCGQCSGSGEGMHDGTRCLHCKGTGSEPDGEDDEDYDDGED